MTQGDHVILRKPPYLGPEKIMVGTCIVGCMNRSHPDSLISFHFIPAVIINHGSRKEVLFAKGHATWLAKINRKDWIPTKSSFFVGCILLWLVY